MDTSDAAESAAVLEVVEQVLVALGGVEKLTRRQRAASIMAQLPDDPASAAVVLEHVRELLEWTSAPPTRRYSLRKAAGFKQNDL